MIVQSYQKKFLATAEIPCETCAAASKRISSLGHAATSKPDKAFGRILGLPH